MMTQLHGTVNYVYSSDDLLGRGATCQVYKGVNKRTGEVRALKVFDPRVDALFKREIDALKFLQHANIVQYYGYETEVTSRRLVAVVEYCEGGSLHGLLTEPENVKGIDDQEFLRLLSHMAEGLCYLRQREFVHRDIKPGNILLKKDEDGNNIYKLTDFGTAKALGDDERFQSLVGTEEYLHPDIFRAAFIEPHQVHKFDVTVDLWSLGATLYHAATGNVPFRPYKGRNDKAIMYKLITRKAKGVISGVQTSESEDINWSHTLPEDCRLSSGLKLYVTDILANLLETAQTRTWGFDEFFAAVRETCDKKPLNFFSTVHATHHIAYIDKTSSYSHLQDQIHQQTDIAVADQCLLYGENDLLAGAEVTETVNFSHLTMISATNPIVVLHIKPCGHADKDKPMLSAYPIEVSIKFPNLVRYDHDDRQARRICEALADMLYHIKLGLQAMDILNRTVRVCRTLDQSVLTRCEVELLSLRERITDVKAMLSHTVTEDPQSTGNQSRSNNSCNVGEILSVLTQCMDVIQTASENFEKIPLMFSKEAVQCKKRLSRLYAESRAIHKMFHERRQRRSVPYHEKQLHEFDRHKLENIYSKAVTIWCDQFITVFENSHSAFLDWYSDHLNETCSIEHVHGEIQEVKDSIAHMVKTGTVIVGNTRPTSNLNGLPTLSSHFTKALRNLNKTTSDCRSLILTGREGMKRLSDQICDLPGPQTFDPS